MRGAGGVGSFGPWIEQVRSAEDLPRPFRGSRIVPEHHRLVLTVPRSIDVRDATPDMHLYDYLVAVDDQAVTVLSRRGDTYDTTRLTTDQIVAIEDSLSLLDGRLALRTARGAHLVIPYNGAAGATVRSLVELVRTVYLPPGPLRAPSPEAPGPDRLVHTLGGRDRGLVAAYREVVAQRFRARQLAAAPRQPVLPVSGRLRRALHRARPVTLHAVIALADDRELLLIHRRRWFTREDADVYSCARTVVPRARISSITARPHPGYERVDLVTVQAGSALLTFPVPAGSDVAALVAEVGASGDPGRA